MVVLATTIAIINFLFYVVAKSFNRWLAYSHLFVLFIFAFIVSEQQFSIFYLILFIIAIIISEFVRQVNVDEQQFNISTGRFSASGFKFILISLAVGLVMFVTIKILEQQVGGRIVGAPDLAITTGSIAQVFKPTFESMLGIIENLFAVVIFEVLLVFGILLPVIGKLIELSFVILPIAISAFIMGIFHVAAFSVSASLIIWATVAFAMFIAAAFFLKNTLASDFAHWLINLSVSIGRGLQIVG